MATASLAVRPAARSGQPSSTTEGPPTRPEALARVADPCCEATRCPGLTMADLAHLAAGAGWCRRTGSEDPDEGEEFSHETDFAAVVRAAAGLSRRNRRRVSRDHEGMLRRVALDALMLADNPAVRIEPVLLELLDEVGRIVGWYADAATVNRNSPHREAIDERFSAERASDQSCDFCGTRLRREDAFPVAIPAEEGRPERLLRLNYGDCRAVVCCAFCHEARSRREPSMWAMMVLGAEFS